MPVRLLRPYNGQNANTLYVGTDEAILRAIGIADDYIENATNFVPFASQAFRAFASSFSTGSPAGSFITSFSNPFAGQGRGITTYTLTGTVPPQVALSATGRTLVVGSTAAVAGTIYSVNVTATSGDGLLTTQPATLNFMAMAQLPLVGGYGGTVPVIPMATTGVLAQVGDSIAAGYLASYAYITRLGYGGGITIANQYAQTGHTVAQIPTDVPNGLTSIYQNGKTNVAIFERGINDIRVDGKNGAQVYALVAPYIAAYKNQGFYVAITTLLPYTDGVGGANAQTAISDYNALVRANSAGADAIIDFAADPLMGAATAPNDTTLYVDKLHPTTLGQDKLAAIVYPIVNNLLLRSARLPVAVSAPTNSTAPSISTNAVVGTALNLTNGSWTQSPTSYSYQWRYADTSAVISGATANSYTPVTADIGHTLQGGVIATNAAGSSSVTWSNTTSAVVASGGTGTPAASFRGNNLTMANPVYTADDDATMGQALSGGYGYTAGTFGTAGANVPGVPVGAPYAIGLRFKTPSTNPSGASIIASQDKRFAVGMGTDGRLVAAVYSGADDTIQFIGGGSFTGGSTLSVMSLNSYHTVVLNVISTGATVFLDGVQVGTITVSTKQTANITPFGVRMHGGANPVGQFSFTGAISEVAVFVATQAATIMNAPLTYSTADIAELWHLDGSGNAAAS